MSKALCIGSIVLIVTACTGGTANDAAKQGGSATTRSERASSGERTLASGTRITATMENALSSRTNKPGETLRATVSRDVTDDRGNVVVPAGSTVSLTIDKLEPGSAQVRPEGRLSLIVTSLSVNGRTYPVAADLEPVAHEMKGRGITTDEAARVGAGTAIGAVVGQAIGKDTRSTTIGGAVGAVAGGAVAVRYAYRDVVVSAGTAIAFTLTQSLNVSAK